VAGNDDGIDVPVALPKAAEYRAQPAFRLCGRIGNNFALPYHKRMHDRFQALKESSSRLIN
jgi:hypothetical protein